MMGTRADRDGNRSVRPTAQLGLGRRLGDRSETPRLGII